MTPGSGTGTTAQIDRNEAIHVYIYPECICQVRFVRVSCETVVSSKDSFQHLPKLTLDWGGGKASTVRLGENQMPTK